MAKNEKPDKRIAEGPGRQTTCTMWRLELGILIPDSPSKGRRIYRLAPQQATVAI